MIWQIDSQRRADANIVALHDTEKENCVQVNNDNQY